MVKKLLERNNNIIVPLPEKVVRHVGLHSGSYVEITDDGYHVILTPVEEEFTEEEWEKIISLKKDKGKIFKSSKAFMKHLKELIKK